MPINIYIIAMATAATLAGFFGKTFDDKAEHKRLIKRITLRGWAYLMFVVVGFGLSIYKERTSFEGQVGSVDPNFYPLVSQVTGYSRDEWTKVISYRMSLRFLLQKLYAKVFPGEPRPDSMEVMLNRLAHNGTISDNFCSQLDYLRFYTFSAEWGSGQEPGPTVLNWFRSNADSTLKQLAGTVDVPLHLSANPSTACGTYLKSPPPLLK